MNIPQKKIAKNPEPFQSRKGSQKGSGFLFFSGYAATFALLRRGRY